MARRLNEAEEIINRAKKGEPVSTSQRRHAVGYLMSTQGDLTNMQLAELFDVTDRTIRDDKTYVRKQAAELVTTEDIALVISDIRLSFERYAQRIEQGLKKATVGTANYLNYLNAGMTMQLKVVEALQNLGWYPKNLGQLTKKEFNFTAIVTKDGTVDTRPTELLDPLIENPHAVIDVTPEPKQLPPVDQNERDAFDAEFGTQPQPVPVQR